MDLFTLFVSFDPPVQAALGLVLLLALAGCVQVVVQYVLLHTVPRIRERMDRGWARVVWHDKVLRRLARVVPSVVVQAGIADVPHLHPVASVVIRNVAVALTVRAPLVGAAVEARVGEMLRAVFDAEAALLGGAP